MQAHLHALFEAGDLLYDDEYAALRMSPLFAFVTETGVVSNHWPIGASFVQAPGWLLGRAAGASLVGAGVSERAATWTLPLLGVRTWALLVLAWLTVTIFRWLRARAGPRPAALACAAFVLGTPALVYASEYAIRPHLWGAAVVAIAIMRWHEAIERACEDPERALARWETPASLALWVGLATAIRPQLAILALLVAHERVVATRELGPRARAKIIVGHGLMAALLFAIWPALVVRMQLWMYGGLGDYAGEVSHHLQAFLLSTHHGALTWCPVLVIGVLGLAIGVATGREGAALVLVLLAAQIWLDAGTREIEPYRVLGTRTWAGGTAFGPRKLLDAIPLMLPGVVWLVAWIDSQSPAEARAWRRRLSAATIVALIPTILLACAAFIDHRVCTLILDPDRFLIALGLAFDPGAWADAWAARALPSSVALRGALVVGLPLSTLVVVALAVGGRRGPRTRRARPGAMVALMAGGLVANAWIGWLQGHSEAMAEDDPARMQRAAATLNPWHEQLVGEIPRAHARMRARLGDHAVP